MSVPCFLSTLCSRTQKMNTEPPLDIIVNQFILFRSLERLVVRPILFLSSQLFSLFPDTDSQLVYIIIIALQLFIGPWQIFCFLIFYTVGRTPWRGDQPVARPPPTHKHRINAYKHPCLEWDSNPRSQNSRERRQFMP
jgi:hypothetical protein